ncbi:hypothetical protein HHI36_004083 [Cryptolaemus montrouzieri]|uniref:Uncharacterized protein n=1 Tax=Cryptolaemus montrouzieri TaxID=559131 RepID=A0ABD2NQT1_9CUCU
MQKCTKPNLKESSQTRWSAKHQAVTALLNNLPEVVKALQEIEEFSSVAESKYEAGHLLHAIKEAAAISEKLKIEPVLQNKRISKKKREHDEFCENESRPLDLYGLFSKDLKAVFDKILTEIKTRVESAKGLHENFGSLSDNAILNMSTDDLQKNGADLARKYSKDLNAVDFCQKLPVFKDLVSELNEKSSAFDLLQHLCKKRFLMLV